VHSQPASEQRAGLGAFIEGLLVARCTASLRGPSLRLAGHVVSFFEFWRRPGPGRKFHRSSPAHADALQLSTLPFNAPE
jgi:hypothetical protein